MRIPSVLLILALACCATVSAQEILHWTMDEGVGTTAGDSSGHGNAGIVAGGMQWVGDADRGPVVLFNGGASNIPRAQAQGLLWEMSIGFWMHTGDWNHSTTMLSYQLPSAQGALVIANEYQ